MCFCMNDAIPLSYSFPLEKYAFTLAVLKEYYYLHVTTPRDLVIFILRSQNVSAGNDSAGIVT